MILVSASSCEQWRCCTSMRLEKTSFLKWRWIPWYHPQSDPELSLRVHSYLIFGVGVRQKLFCCQFPNRGAVLNVVSSGWFATWRLSSVVSFNKFGKSYLSNTRWTSSYLLVVQFSVALHGSDNWQRFEPTMVFKLLDRLPCRLWQSLSWEWLGCSLRKCPPAAAHQSQLTSLVDSLGCSWVYFCLSMTVLCGPWQRGLLKAKWIHTGRWHASSGFLVVSWPRLVCVQTVICHLSVLQLGLPVWTSQFFWYFTTSSVEPWPFCPKGWFHLC